MEAWETVSQEGTQEIRWLNVISSWMGSWGKEKDHLKVRKPKEIWKLADMSILVL